MKADLPTRTCFYEGTIVHRRFRPVEHSFRYRLALTMLDVDEADRLLAPRGLWSSQPFSVARFRREDHLGEPDRPLADCVKDLVETRIGRRPAGPVGLLTNFRFFGFQMNPVSFFYCYDDAGSLDAVVAEVSNTPWNERHEYVVDLQVDSNDRPRTAKSFHVSPFMGMDMEYRWRVGVPGDVANVHIESHDDSGKLFEAALALRRVEWTAASRRRMLVSHPFATLQVFAKIYWQAFRLWMKKVPYVPHPAARIAAVPQEVVR